MIELGTFVKMRIYRIRRDCMPALLVGLSLGLLVIYFLFYQHRAIQIDDKYMLQTDGSGRVPYSMSADTERDITYMNLTRPEYLSNYKNPCWYEALPNDLTYIYKLRQNPYSNRTEDFFSGIRSVMMDRLSTDTRTRLRCIPHVFIIGVAKSGTTDLYTLLSTHPEVVVGANKEPMYWHDTRYTLNQTYSDYLDLYDEAADIIDHQVVLRLDQDGRDIMYHPSITVDASTTSLVRFPAWRSVPGNHGNSRGDKYGPVYTTADVIHRVHPDAKIIAILRNPTDRLYSEYVFFNQITNRTFKPDPGEFHVLVSSGINKINTCLERYTLRYCVYTEDTAQARHWTLVESGIYYPFVKDWLKVFTSDNIKILSTHGYHGNRTHVYKSLTRFLELSDHISPYLDTDRIVNEGIRPPAMLHETHHLLDTFYQPYNSLLAQLLHDEQFLFNT